MPFRPKNERHAIQEVVFVLSFARGFKGAEFDDVAAAHNQWIADLPKIERPIGFEVTLGSGVPQVAPTVQQLNAVRFESIRRDGSLDWRLGVENNWIAVNCLNYTRWADIWGRARALLSAASKLVDAQDNKVVAMSLQYIDLFEWEGAPEKYSVDGLFRKKSNYIPESVRDRGPFWHLHQGWFIKANLPVEGRILERMHVDAAEYEPQKFSVKMDSLHRMDIADPTLECADLFEGEASIADQAFNHFHTLNKQLMLEYLSEEMARRIDLNAQQ